MVMLCLWGVFASGFWVSKLLINGFVLVPFGFACKGFYLSDFSLHLFFASNYLRFCAGKVLFFVGSSFYLKLGVICLFGCMQRGWWFLTLSLFEDRVEVHLLDLLREFCHSPRLHLKDFQPYLMVFLIRCFINLCNHFFKSFVWIMGLGFEAIWLIDD